MWHQITELAPAMDRDPRALLRNRLGKGRKDSRLSGAALSLRREGGRQEEPPGLGEGLS